MGLMGRLAKMKESRVAGGRVAVYIPEHPSANNRGYILKSRFIMEQKLGRILRPDEEVHHKDEDSLNDAEDNFEVISTAEHARLHAIKRMPRILNYEKIKILRKQGFGYKKIAHILGSNRHSVESACRFLERGSYK